jgi:hypothetical protein
MSSFGWAMRREIDEGMEGDVWGRG